MYMPSELLADPREAAKVVFFTPELQKALPELPGAFQQVDAKFTSDPEAYLTNLHENIFSFQQEKSIINGSIIANETTAQSGKVLVIFSAFSDGAPQSSAETIAAYIQNPAPSFTEQQRAKPNSWNQSTKSAVAHDLLEALGEGMSVLTIYSPIPPSSYTSDEKKDIRQGILSPAAKTAQNALAHAEKILSDKYGSDIRFTEAHFHGESLGDNALGTAYVFKKNENQLERIAKSVTAQEFILGPKNIVDLFGRFTLKQYVGEPPQIYVPDSFLPISEPIMRQGIVKRGNELVTYARMVNAMSKLTHLIGLTKPDWLAARVNDLVHMGVDVTVANAINSSMSYQTLSYLPVGHEKLHSITFKGTEGQKIGHLADEHVALGAIVTALGIKRAHNIAR